MSDVHQAALLPGRFIEPSTRFRCDCCSALADYATRFLDSGWNYWLCPAHRMLTEREIIPLFAVKFGISAEHMAERLARAT